MIVGIFDNDSISFGFDTVLGIGTEAPTRGPKTVAPDVYEGPDISPSTGNYDLPGLDVLRADAAASRAMSAPAAPPKVAPSSLPSWLLPAGIFVAGTAVLLAMHWRQL